MRRLALLAVAALLLAGCGERTERTRPGKTQQFQLMLDFLPNADHAGIYAAQANHRFSDVGLDVKIRVPSDPAAPIRQVAAGRVDLAISYEPEVLRARDHGLKVVSVGALVQRPLTTIIALPGSRIKKPADLRGKTVGTAGIDYQHAFLQTILERAAVPPASVKERNVGFNLVPALLTKKVDAILGGFLNYEAVELRQRKKKPVVIPVDRVGVPRYDELVFVTSESAARENADAIRAFLGAVARGTHDLRSDPVSALVKANPDLDAKLQRAAVKVTMPLFQPPSGKPFGYQEPGRWRTFADFMRKSGLIQHPASSRGAFTNGLLPGQGP
ncbi:MAG: putative hydroxymethylpyrimidine transport system substrate-binding protein [Thermoleophilaceae bacterium]|nr:putative hydroxymethylpyrimidine transport system substrate-binding protein [Thermoleophilaceae bacterium]